MSILQESSVLYLAATYVVSVAVCWVLIWQYWRDPNMPASDRSTAIFFVCFIMLPISIIPILNTMFAIYLFSKWKQRNIRF